ncbi:uncharacterized protein PAC_15853 [Phialocephala subalpina]|uniref:NACHT-NTPase and P-loop NTPases N-terminal domain-containing protein n=1 Tax=Phialocephala subalpina TaxID=576137 RepID=A0A1L7XLR0_9HELO|nr:uncharacterized protein PAC_15853 [Phialocephala subalpina]
MWQQADPSFDGEADVLGTTSAIVALLETAINLIQRLRKARDSINRTSQTLDNITKQLNTLFSTLNLVKEEETLQTASVGQQLQAIVEVAKELSDFFDKVKAEQERQTVRRFLHALKSGDEEDVELAAIFDRLDKARLELVLRISLAQVGLIGNLQDGFSVAIGVLQETNTNVKQILGRDLSLAIRLEDNQPQHADGTVPLDQADIEALGLDAALETAADDATVTESDSTTIVDNITLGQARIMTGDIGVESWQRRVTRRTIIAKNKFGGDVRIVTGDMGGKAAATFNESFW